MNRSYLLSLLSIILLIVAGCGSNIPEPPVLNEANRSAIEEHDALIEQEEAAL